MKKNHGMYFTCMLYPEYHHSYLYLYVAEIIELFGYLISFRLAYFKWYIPSYDAKLQNKHLDFIV